MLAGLGNVLQITELRNKVVFTLLMFAVFRAGTHIPVPGVNAAVIEQLFTSGNLFGLLDLFAGGALSKFSIFAMSITPYIIASIILQLLTVGVPTLERWSKEGEDGRKKIVPVCGSSKSSRNTAKYFDEVVYCEVKNKKLSRAEAAELMEMMRQLMENMQVTMGEGQGQGPGSQSMRDLSDTLRDQQGLSDDAFRQLQQGPNGQQGEGQPGQGQQGEGQDGRSLAERQRDLRNRLNGLDDSQLPGQGSERGESGRRALNDAGRAMEDAERALRDGDLPGALDRQAEAMEALREGMRDLGEAMAQEGRQQDGQAQGEAFGRADPNSQRDPLGREPGETGRIGSDRNMLQGEDVYRRAQDLLDEIRRRSGDQSRPEIERDYLRRLLDMY